MMSETDEITLPTELQNLSNLVDSQPESLAPGSNDLQLTALRATKYIYDLALKSEARSREHITELLASISPNLAPQTRSQSKRKRSPSLENVPTLQETPLTELFVNGMDEDQIWEQLELRAKNVCSNLEYVLDGAGESLDDDEDNKTGAKKRMKLSLRDDEDMEDLEHEDMDSEDDDEDDSEETDEEASTDEEEEEEGDEDLGEEVVDLRDPLDEEDGEEVYTTLDLGESTSVSVIQWKPKRKEGDEDLGEGVDLRDPSDEEDGEEEYTTLDLGESTSVSVIQWKPKRKSGGHPELDDGFFDLAAFNAETEEAEARAVSKGRLGTSGSDDEDEDEEAPIDLFAPVDVTPLDDEETESSEPFYKDFFDSPPRTASSKLKGKARAHDVLGASSSRVRFHEEVKVRNIKARGKNLPVSILYDQGKDDEDDDAMPSAEYEYGEMSMEDDEDGSDDEDGGEEDEDESQESFSGDDSLEDEVEEDDRETIERFKDDLFAEEEEEQPNLSTHEKRMLALREEIVALEAENVARKDWTLMGEANARSRPQNSLLEEDLEYERVIKLVPVITEEVVQSLEERIKARVVENQFDDVVRKRPVDDKAFLPSRFFELQDAKSKLSLAEIYEDEYTAAQSGGVAGEDRDGKLKKEHEEIEKLWEQICGKLDALSNAHFTPKAPKATISTVANVAAASMESALPTTLSTSSMLAPEEVFAPPISTELQARSELTPTEKRALRNKQKKAKKKARDVLEQSVDKFAKSKRTGSIKKQKEAALKSVVKSGKGVTVVGKKSQEVLGKRTRSKS